MAPRNFKVQYFNDFTGGLNNKTQAAGLQLNESPDCLDIDFNARGGFACRRGFQETFTDPKMFDLVNQSQGYVDGQFVAGGVEMLYGFDAFQDFWTFTAGGTLTIDTSTPNNADVGTVVRSAVWGGKLYFANWIASGTWYMKSWNGSAFAALTNTANNDYTNPTSGNAPQAKLIANHSGHLWWAHTREGGVEFPSRVRFSHPLQPENFADADYFDIDPDDSDKITAIVPFKDQLLVFKQRSVYAVFGYDRESFVVERLAGTAGVSCPKVVDANSGICYWWSVDGNVFAYNGRGIVPVGERITGVVDSGRVVSGCVTNAVCWAQNRLFVSLRLVDDSRVTFVYDPAVGQNGAWTKYGVYPMSMIWWRTADTTKNALYFFEFGAEFMADFDNAEQQVDVVNGFDRPIRAYYRTAWFVSGDSGLKKRWRRPHVTVACKDSAVLEVDVFHNYVESTPVKRLTLPVVSYNTDSSLLWNNAAGTAGGDWGESWSLSGGEENYEFDRLPALGRSNAVQLRFEMKEHGSKWWVDSFTIPFLEKTYR